MVKKSTTDKSNSSADLSDARDVVDDTNVTNPTQGPVLRFLWSGWKKINIGLPGLWLATLYVFFGVTVILALSAHQLQYKILSLKGNANGDNTGVWALSQLDVEWNDLNDKITTNSTKLGDLRLEITGLRQQRASLTSKINSVGGNDCFKLLNSTNIYLTDTFNNYKKVEYVDCNPSDHAIISQQVEAFINDDSTAQDIKSVLQSKTVLLKNLNDTIKETGALKNEALTVGNVLFDVEEQIIGLSETIQKDREVQKKLLGGSSLGEGAGDFLNALQYLTIIETSMFIPKFSKMPPDMLTLILVMSMGALGGTISLTRSYLVILPFLMGLNCRIYAAILSFCIGVIPPIPILGRSLLYVQSHRVA